MGNSFPKVATLSALELRPCRLRALRASPLQHLGASVSHPWAPEAVSASLKSNFHNTTQSWVMSISIIIHSLETGQEISITFTNFNRKCKLVLNSLFCFYKGREQTLGSSDNPSQSESCWMCECVWPEVWSKSVLSLRSWIFIQLPDQSYSCLRAQIKCRFLFISVLQQSFVLCISEIRNISVCQRKLAQWRHKQNKNFS